MSLFEKLFGKNTQYKEGLNEFYYPNKKLKERGNLENGKKVGTWEYFYENGNKKGIQEYQLGNIQGRGQFFYENGSLRLICNYEDGKLEGLSKLYDPEGRVRSWSFTSYDQEGRQVGVHQNLHENNLIESIGNTLEGKKEGTWFFFDEKEKLISQKEVKRGEVIDINEDITYLETVETYVKNNNFFNLDQDLRTESKTSEDENLLSGITIQDMKDSIEGVTGNTPRVLEIEGMTTFMFNNDENKEYRGVVEPVFNIKTTKDEYEDEDHPWGKYMMEVLVEGQLVEEWFHNDKEEIELRRSGYRVVYRTHHEESGKRHTEILNKMKNYQRHGEYWWREVCDWISPERRMCEMGYYLNDKKDGEFNIYGSGNKIIKKEVYIEDELTESESFKD